MLQSTMCESEWVNELVEGISLRPEGLNVPSLDGLLREQNLVEGLALEQLNEDKIGRT